MAYLVCMPMPEVVSRENCEKIHNILARMSDRYKINIVPEPVKKKQGSCPAFYKKYRIYTEIRESGDAYLTSAEEKMILSVCRNEDEEALMKGCAYAYQYPSSMTIRAFREDTKGQKVLRTGDKSAKQTG